MTEPLRIAVAGSSDFTRPALEALIESEHHVVAVYTQPDRPAGRGRKLRANIIKQTALDHDIPVYQPTSLKSDEVQAALESLQLDLMVVAAYGLILPQATLDTPAMGCWNLHGSILPRWRGAAPVQRAIIAGDSETGVTLMQMDAGLDTGDILAITETPIHSDDTGGSLHDCLADMGAQLLIESLARRQQLTASGQPQEGVTYASKMSKSEAQIDWQEPAELISRKIRAYNPWPVAHGELAGDTVRIWNAHPEPGQGTPGEIISLDNQQLHVATGDGLINITEIQRPGGKRMSAIDFLNAHRQHMSRDTQGSHSQ